MNRTRPVQMIVRLSTDEAATVKQKIESSGLNSQKYLLAAVLGKEIKNQEYQKSLIPELKRIGNNLNQATRLLHILVKSKGRDDRLIGVLADLQKNQKELELLWQSIKV